MAVGSRSELVCNTVSIVSEIATVTFGTSQFRRATVTIDGLTGALEFWRLLADRAGMDVRL